MKNNYLFLVLLLCSIFSSKLNAQIPNGGFENWNDAFLFNDLPPYLTTNFQSYPAINVPNVTQVAGVTGNAVRLETVTDGSEFIPGGLILAKIGGDFGISPGYPFSSEPDSITGYFRYDIQPGDTASIFLLFYNNGTPVNFGNASFVGQSTDFTYHSFEIPNFFFAPDSILVTIASSIDEPPSAGSWIEMDDIVFTSSSDQLPNNDFENWVDIEAEEPQDWFTSNILSAISNGPFAVTKTDDAYAGNFALQLETVEISFLGSEPDTIGYTSTGIIDGDEGIEGGFPYTEQPDKLSGYYKYTPVGNDTAVVNVYFTKYNSGTGETDELFEQTILLPPTNSYTLFEMPISLSEIPDTANVAIGSSNYADEDNFIGVGSVLIIDELAFEFVDGTKTPLFTEQLNVFPNPAQNYTNIDLSSIKGEVQSILIFDALGRKVIELDDSQQFINTLKINTSNLQNGIYLYLVKTDEGDFSGKLKIEK